MKFALKDKVINTIFKYFVFTILKACKKTIIKCIIPPSFGITVQIGPKEKQCNQ